MTCSRCGSRHPNRNCNVCRETAEEEAAREEHEAETSDRDRKEAA